MGCDNHILLDKVGDVVLTTYMIEEMARADSWKDIDECLATKPDEIARYGRYAEAALRAVKRLERGMKGG
jgi:hypothetical protein